MSVKTNRGFLCTPLTTEPLDAVACIPQGTAPSPSWPDPNLWLGIVAGWWSDVGRSCSRNLQAEHVTDKQQKCHGQYKWCILLSTDSFPCHNNATSSHLDIYDGRAKLDTELLDFV
jgi:hypothetical protein